jgi:phosphate-selective porin
MPAQRALPPLRFASAGVLALLFSLPLPVGAFGQSDPGGAGAAPEAGQPAAAVPPADLRNGAGSAVRFVWANDRPSLRLWADRVRLDFRARLQGDVFGGGGESGGRDAFDLRRRRVGVDGVVGGFLEFEVERDLWSDKGWRDAFVNVRLADAAQVKAGQFKLPFSMDELTSSTSLDFVYRSLAASALAPARDVGVMFHGRSALPGRGSRLEYEAGVFRHDGDNAGLGPLTRRSADTGLPVSRRTVAGRLQISPFDTRPRKDPAGGKAGGGAAGKAAAGKAEGGRAVMQSLRLGVAVTVNDVPPGDNGLRGQDALSTPFFPRLDVNGRRVRVGAEASWGHGPADVRAELIQVRDQRRAQGLGNEDLPDVVATGWYVQGTWELVHGGKKASRAGRWIGRGGVGDIELAARSERLQFGSAGTGGEPPSVSPRAGNLAAVSDTVMTLGVNWRPVPLARIQMNVIRDDIGGFQWTEIARQDIVWSVVARFQVAF